jgi:GGDEF domain-containing protein
VTVLIFDIDHFKSINDRFGHPAGDEILKLFATIVINSLRITDLSGRIGGEEFAALLTCSLDEAVVVAERVREAFANSGIAVEDGPVDTTVSIGVRRRAGGHRARGIARGRRCRALSGQARWPQSRRGRRGAALVPGKLAAKDRGDRASAAAAA